MLNARQYFQTFYQGLISLYGEDEARAITNYVTSEVLLVKFHQLAVINKILSEEDVTYFNKMHERLLHSEPVQYVLGYTWFCGLKFEVNNQVLIPRPETEELVEMVIQYCRAHKIIEPRILDIGTGSGCIAIALKKNIPGSVVTALDLMEGALAVAAKNTVLNKVEINLIAGDILETNHTGYKDQFDIIVSNPPYIHVKEESEMHSNVKRFEPEAALFSPGDVLKFYKAIKFFSDLNLAKKGSVWLEINPLYAHETIDLFKGTKAELINDMSGKNRFAKVIFP